MVDADITDRVFGSKSGNDKSTGRKFYWDGPIEVEMPNKVQRYFFLIENNCPFQYMPVMDDFLRMKNCEIKEQAMGRNEEINALSLSLFSLCCRHYQTL